jgi:2-dehydropantoate 2-reductase
MKICVYGAGAIGSWMGVKLARAGHDLRVVARGASLAAISANGLRLLDGGEEVVAPAQASSRPSDLGVQDIVIVAVKAPAMPSVADEIGPLIGPATIVITAMNGIPWWFCSGLAGDFAHRHVQAVDRDGRIARAIPSAQTMGCVVHASCMGIEPGVVKHHMGNTLIFGEAVGQSSARVEQVVAMFRQAGFDASASPLIQRDVWYKLWGNLTMNPISAITGATTDRILGDPLVREFVTNIMIEAKEIGTRLGLPIDQTPEERHAVTGKLGAMRTSMLQDVASGKQVELDALVGAVCELGAITGVPTPYTSALFGLARLHARELGLYSSLQ